MEESKTGTRRLAAIMFTDMVGFSALTQRDEALALRLLGEHNDIFREVLAKYEGREVKSTGDGFLIEFPSALEAVKCAIAVQQAVHDRNLVEEDKIGVRVGIHVGDVVSRDGDIFGDGVNIASRIEPLADSGGICVSNAVAEQVENKISNPLASIGKADLKHIDVPMEVHKVYMPWESGAPAKRRRKKRRLLPWPVATVVVAGLAVGGWMLIGPMINPPMTEAQKLMNHAVELVKDPMANRDSYMSALDLSQRAVNLEPLNGRSFAIAAQIAFKTMELYDDEERPEMAEQAKGYVARAKQFAPDSVETGLATYYLERFEHDPDARLHLLKLRDRFPKEPRIAEDLAREALARLDKRKPDFTEFEKWRAEVREMGGNEYRILVWKAYQMYLDSHVRLALQAADESLACRENTDAYMVKLATLTMGLEDFKRAEELLPQIPDSMRQDDGTVYIMYRNYYWSGQYQKAIDELANFGRPFVRPGNAIVPIDYLRGQAYGKLGADSIAKRSYEAALAAVDKRLKDAPNDRLLLTAKALALFKLGRREEAMPVGQAAKELWKRTYTALDMAMGHYKEVLDALHDRIVDRGDFGLLQFTEAKYAPYFDPIRNDPRFKKIMKAGEEWMNEEKSN
ncbi:MAG TPA: adenylate/guanylate cyclase domain-containing protein [Fimbriimonadaceae bacterium]|nr:adenylate/guanylate cyclase domain-containing protein [Fimbriimonadaceae bacterium]